MSYKLKFHSSKNESRLVVTHTPWRYVSLTRDTVHTHTKQKKKREFHQQFVIIITLTTIRYFTYSYSTGHKLKKRNRKLKLILKWTAVFTSQRPQFPWRSCSFSGVGRFSRSAATGLLQNITLSVECFS